MTVAMKGDSATINPRRYIAMHSLDSHEGVERQFFSDRGRDSGQVLLTLLLQKRRNCKENCVPIN